jgi:diaminopimelate decarboxylase
MSDNPRPALYQAGYEAVLANRMGESLTERVSVGGKCCESGDILIENIDMPIVRVGDFLVVGSTGAYNYSMSSNYNRIPRPPVIMLKNGIDELVVKRESYDDLLRNDL